MNVLMPLAVVGAWALVAFVLLILGYRRPVFHWALVFYFVASMVVGVIWSFIRWGWPA